MTRLFVTVLLIWAQLFACGLQSEFVLCVHGDGSCAIEFSSSRCCAGVAETAADDACCSEDATGAQPCADDDSRDDAGARASGDDDCCRDYALRLHSPTVEADDAPSPSDVHTAATAPASATTTSSLNPGPGTHPPRVRERGPPPRDTSRLSLRSVRLRC